jgi:hypothetical protein
MPFQGQIAAEPTRRRFTGLLPAGLALASAEFRLLEGSQRVSSQVDSPSSSLLTGERFLPLVGSRFHAVSGSGARHSLVLMAVENLAAGMEQTPLTESSLLRFSTGGAILREGTYRMRDCGGKTFSLHLNPARDGSVLAYLVHVSPEYLASLAKHRG